MTLTRGNPIVLSRRPTVRRFPVVALSAALVAVLFPLSSAEAQPRKEKAAEPKADA